MSVLGASTGKAGVAGPAACAWEEEPLFLEAAGETLFGVLTHPIGARLEVGALVLPQQATIQSNSLSVRLARRLAAQGFDALRLDFHGAGESTGTAQVDLEQPFVDDVQAAVRWLRSRGLRRFVLVGGCFGARTVLAASPDVEGLEGVVLAAMPLRDEPALQVERLGRLVRGSLSRSTLRSLATAEGRAMFARFLRTEARWLLKRLGGFGRVLRRLRKRYVHARGRAGRAPSPVVLRSLGRLVEQGVPLLFVFGRSDPYYEHFQASLAAELAPIADAAAGRLEVEDSFEGELHGFKTLAAQRHFLDASEGWLVRVVGPR